MATLTGLIGNIRTTASGPVMRERIATAFETVRDGYVTEVKTASFTNVAAGNTSSLTVSASLSGYTPIGVINVKSSSTTILPLGVHIDGTSIKGYAYNTGTATGNATFTITVLYKSNNLA